MSWFPWAVPILVLIRPLEARSALCDLAPGFAVESHSSETWLGKKAADSRRLEIQTQKRVGQFYFFYFLFYSVFYVQDFHLIDAYWKNAEHSPQLPDSSSHLFLFLILFSIVLGVHTHAHVFHVRFQSILMI